MNKLHFTSLDSTNNYLKNNYKSLENYTFVSADVQSDGKGRNNRKWISENGKNLLFSLLILDKQLFKSYKEISILTAYAILKVLKKSGISDLKIKWPNDIYVGDKKICGILLESVCKNEMECLIVGAGLNVNEDSFNGEYRTLPTSLKCELKKDINIDSLKDDIYNEIINILEDVKNNKNHYLDICEYDYLKGKEAIYDGNKIIIKGIDEDYSLKIIKDNKEHNIDSGEIVL